MVSEKKINDFKKITNSGQLYDSGDPDFFEYQHSLVQKIIEYNRTDETTEGLKQRAEILKRVTGTYGKNLTILPPINANCGLSDVHFGDDIFINFNCFFVDDGRIDIGDHTMVGPNVTFATAQHPISPKLREKQMQYNKPISIGKNVWIGASATILPGVTVGDNSVIGAGSIVTKDVPENVIVAGNPAKIIRPIDQNDDVVFDKDKKIPDEIIAKYF